MFAECDLIFKTEIQAHIALQKVCDEILKFWPNLVIEDSSTYKGIKKEDINSETNEVAIFKDIASRDAWHTPPADDAEMIYAVACASVISIVGDSFRNNSREILQAIKRFDESGAFKA
jgi:hypothetical protein